MITPKLVEAGISLVDPSRIRLRLASSPEFSSRALGMAFPDSISVKQACNDSRRFVVQLIDGPETVRNQKDLSRPTTQKF